MPNFNKTLKTLAKQKGISVTKLKTEMQTAINAAYVTPNFHAVCVPSKGNVPTVEEMLEYAVNRAEMLVKEK